MLLSGMATAFGQLTEVRVFDREGRPLPAAVVELRLVRLSYLADSSGRLRLKISGKDTLVVSFMGYRRQQRAVDGRTGKLQEFFMEESAGTLEVVTVSTGYQRIPRERSTGAFGLVDEKLLSQQIGTNVMDRLPYLSSALNLDRRGAGGNQLSVRGLSTIQGPSAPLVVVDNFPYQGELENINPNDVESITILKDAAATSIWGAKAGNGVIVITTKKGTLGKPFSVSFGASTMMTAKPDLFGLQQMSPSEMVDVELMLFERGRFDAVSPAALMAPVSPLVALLRRHRSGAVDDAQLAEAVQGFRDSDVRNEFSRYFYRNGLNQQYSLQLSGSAEKLAWRTSFGHDRNSSELGAGYQRTNLNISALLTPLKGLEVSLGLLLTRSISTGGRPGYGSVSVPGGELPMYTRFACDDGRPLAVAKDYSLAYLQGLPATLLDWKYYPLEDYRHTDVSSRLDDVVLDIGLRQKLAKGLQGELSYRNQQQRTDGENLYGQQSYFVRNLVNNFSQLNVQSGALSYKVPLGAILDKSIGRRPSYNLRGQLNYNAAIGRHGLALMAGGEMSQDRTMVQRFRTYGLDPEVLTFSQVDVTARYPQYATGALGLIPNNQAMLERTNRFVSAYFNGSYIYLGRYTFSASARRDGSNLFGVLPNNRFNPLGSLGLKWNLGAERFFKAGWVDGLQLKGTLGISGNTDQNRSAYATLAFPASSPYTNTPYAQIGSFANPELRWERVMMLNLGADFSLLKGRIAGSAAYYRKSARDLFGRAQIDYTGGAGESIIKNVGRMTGSGLELELRTKASFLGIDWEAGLDLTRYRDKVTGYYNPNTDGSAFVGKEIPVVTGLVGKPVFGVFSYRWAGLDPLTGDPVGILAGAQSKDYNAIIGRGTSIDQLVYHGSAMPTLFGNFRHTFSYGNFSLTAVLNYKLGYFFTKRSISYNSLYNSRTGHSDFSRRWQKPGDEQFTQVPSMVYPENASRDAFYARSEVNVISGDHLRLQYLSMAWSLAKQRQRWLPVRTASLQLNMNNLGILWRANSHGVDPDYPIGSLTNPFNVAIGLKTNF